MFAHVCGIRVSGSHVLAANFETSSLLSENTQANYCAFLSTALPSTLGATDSHPALSHTVCTYISPLPLPHSATLSSPPQAKEANKELPKDDQEIERKEEEEIDQGFVESSSSEDELTEKGLERSEHCGVVCMVLTWVQVRS